MTVKETDFGQLPDNRQVKLYTCTNANGLVLKMTDYGAICVSLETPDREGKLANITLGFDSLDGYLGRHPFFGATVGRYGNRIAKGRFTLDGKEYTLAQNNNENHLHGGKVGFDKVLWKAKPIKTADAVGVEFSYLSPDGDEGYPGNLSVVTRYVLTNENELRIEFEATTDRATPVNLTNHNYWNLGGAGSGRVLDQQLMLNCDYYLPVDSTLIPTGELATVEGTPMDFRKPQPIGSRFDQLPGEVKGYDHCFVIRGKAGDLRLAARVTDPQSGRVMEISTTQPGVQLYTGNYLAGDSNTNGYGRHEGFCLETQHYPDSPNKPDFPTTILRPDEKLHELTVHRFSVE